MWPKLMLVDRKVQGLGLDFTRLTLGKLLNIESPAPQLKSGDQDSIIIIIMGDLGKD